MPDKTTCPGPEDLARFIAGQGPEDPAAIEQHLKDCPRCVETLGRLEDDGLVQTLRAGETPSNLGESTVVNDLIRRLKELPAREATRDNDATLPPSVPVGNADTLPPVGRAGNSDTLPPANAVAPGPDLRGYLAPPQRPDEMGRIGPYRILKVLGEGGMGIVFLAEDTNLLRMTALKVMIPTVAASEAARARFILEARAAAAIEHDHIVTIYQVGEDRGIPFFAMQLLKGESLEHRIQPPNRRLSVAEVLRIGREVANGLAAAHQRGLIHRDIKPANVWLEEGTGRVKILDFGLVRAVGNELVKAVGNEGGLSIAGAIMGTPEYMSPEQANGIPTDARTDLFSLGSMLYRISTGELPFKGSDMISTVVAVATAEPAPPRTLNPELPQPLSDLIVKLLAKDPADRPASASEVAETLKALEENQPETARKIIGAVRPAGSREKRRRRRLVLTGALLCLVAAAGVFGAWVLHQSLGQSSGHPGGATAGKPAIVTEGIILEAANQATAELISRRGGVTFRKRRTGERATVYFAGEQLRAQVGMSPGDYDMVALESDIPVEFSHKSITVRPGETATVKVSIVKAPAVMVTDFDVILDKDWSEYDAWIHRMDSLHFRPVFFSTYSADKQSRFNAVAVKDDEQRDWLAWTKTTLGDYTAFFSEKRSNGYREILSGPRQTGDTIGYTTFWVLDGLKYWWSDCQLTERQYRDALEDRRSEGQRPLGTCVLRGPDGLIFQCDTAADGGIGWEEHHGLTDKELQALLDGCKTRRWRPDYVHAYEDRDGVRFLVILVENPEDVPWKASLNLSHQQCLQEIHTQRKHALRPLAVAGYLDGGQTRYAAVWVRYQPRGGADLAKDKAALVSAKTMSPRLRWKALYNADEAAFEAWVKEVGETGYHPIHVNGHDLNGKARLAAIAVKDGQNGTWNAYLDLLSAYPERFEKLTTKRNDMPFTYWPLNQAVYTRGNSLRIASIWTPLPFKDGKKLCEHVLSPDEFKAKLAEVKSWNGYPYNLSVYPLGDSYQVAALFGPCPEALTEWWCRYDRSAEEYQAFLDEYQAKGYRLLSISVCPVKGQPRFSAVMVQDATRPRWEAQKDLTATQLADEVNSTASVAVFPD